jgi:hypothetical protein
MDTERGILKCTDARDVARYNRVVASQRELTTLAEATANMIERSRASIARLDKLLAKQDPTTRRQTGIRRNG